MPRFQKPRRQLHPVIRITHWVGAAAMIVMILSGWQIYNASPILPFLFPAWATLGGWLGAGIAWHIAAMWVLMADGLVYLVWSIATGHFRRDWCPISATALRRDFAAALTFRLHHDLNRYNAVQKLLYWLVTVDAIASVATGLSIWKPVQFGPLTWIFGGYDIARRLHFAAMTGIVAFLIVHVVLVALVPSTIRRVTIGVRPPAHPDQPLTKTAA